MLTKLPSAVIRGMDALPVTVETDLRRGMPVFQLVGHADTTVREAKERIQSAIRSSGLEYPLGHIVVNIAPGDLRKRGTILDLAMAMGVLGASEQIFGTEISQYGYLGELSLDGSVRGVKGALPALMALQKSGVTKVILPKENAPEASLVQGIECYPVGSLSEVVGHFNLRQTLAPMTASAIVTEAPSLEVPDFAMVKGREVAKRALMIAAAGNHGILMRGSPATSKTMLAECLPGILPAMTKEEILAVTQGYSVAGLLTKTQPVVTTRPFRRPHHSITLPAMIGGGVYPKPGEITLANKGVLFLDEFCEFDGRVIDALRQPLEEKKIRLHRMAETYEYPADFLFVAAANPCKCGYYGDPTRVCTCTPAAVQQYQQKISGPIMDRIDLHLWLEPVRYQELQGEAGISSAEMREMVERARKMQLDRNQNAGWNGELNAAQVEKLIHFREDCMNFISTAYEHYHLNPRSLLKVKKVSRTLADLDGNVEISMEHVMEALQYRERGQGNE